MISTDKILRLIPYIIIILLSVWFTQLALKDIEKTGQNDWDIFCFSDELARETILDDNQFPLWNPYSNGGRPFLAHPQSGFLRPTFLLPLIFGCVVGLKLEILILCIIGMIGMFLLAKQYGMTTLASLFSSTIFGFSSYFSLHFAEGHATFFSFYLLPFILLFFIKSLTNRAYLFWAALVIVIMIFSGGAAHVVIPTLLFLVIFCLFLAIQKKNTVVVRNFLLLLLLTAGLSAVKTIPMYEFIKDNPRSISTSDSIGIKELHHIFLNKKQFLGTSQFANHEYGWQEYGAYTGIIPLALFAIGIILLFTAQYPLIITGLIFLLISLGNFASWAPWHWLHKLPLFHSLRVPSRFIILFIFCLAIIAGMTINFLQKKGKPLFLKECAIAIVVAFVTIDLILVSGHAFGGVFVFKPVAIEHNEEFRMVHDTNPIRSGARSSLYVNLRANNGSISNYDSSPIVSSYPTGVADPKYQGEVYVLGNGSASYSYWSPNKLTAEISSTDASKIIINQNFDKGWKLSEGILDKHKGLLSANITSQTRQVTFTYLPYSFIAGLVVSILTVCAWFFYILRFKPQRAN